MCSGDGLTLYRTLSQDPSSRFRNPMFCPRHQRLPPPPHHGRSHGMPAASGCPRDRRPAPRLRSPPPLSASAPSLAALPKPCFNTDRRSRGKRLKHTRRGTQNLGLNQATNQNCVRFLTKNKNSQEACKNLIFFKDKTSLEISFLFPFIMCLDQLTIVGVGSMFIFLLVLTVGFYYE